jgi:hypothetical protein
MRRERGNGPQLRHRRDLHRRVRHILNRMGATIAFIALAGGLAFVLYLIWPNITRLLDMPLAEQSIGGILGLLFWAMIFWTVCGLALGALGGRNRLYGHV